MSDCDQFDIGSRQRQICEGTSGLPRSRENLFRLQHGIEPLPGEPVAMRGLGDVVAKVIKIATLGKVKPCGGCQKRRDALNRAVPFTRPKTAIAAKGPPARIVGQGPPIDSLSLNNATRHLTFHIWPVKDFGAWQWNCDRLLANANIFNGRRIVAIAADSQSDTPEMVKEYLAGFTDEVIVVPNDTKLREVATWLPMLKLLEPYQSADDVTFSCHAKCVRHRITADNEGSTVFRWTQAMWELCSRWDIVQPLLENAATVGAFRRFGPHSHKEGFGPWHFSGTFYWWRNRDSFRRNWTYAPQKMFGTEAWPGILFREDESAVIACDKVGDLYKLDYWLKEIEPQLAVWRAKHEQLPALNS